MRSKGFMIKGQVRINDLSVLRLRKRSFYVSLNVLGQSKQTNLYAQEREFLSNILSGLLINSEDNVKKFYDINSYKTMYFNNLLFNNIKYVCSKQQGFHFHLTFRVKHNTKVLKKL